MNTKEKNYRIYCPNLGPIRYYATPRGARRQFWLLLKRNPNIVLQHKVAPNYDWQDYFPHSIGKFE